MRNATTANASAYFSTSGIATVENLTNGRIGQVAQLYLCALLEARSGERRETLKQEVTER